MGFLYGNISQHIPRTNFKIHTIFPSRWDMEQALKRELAYVEEQGENGLNIPEYSYILIDYRSKPHFELYASEDDALAESEYYNVNKEIDNQEYNANFDQTVWQKQRPDVDAIDSYITRVEEEITAETKNMQVIETELYNEIDLYRKSLILNVTEESLKTLLGIPITQGRGLIYISSPEDTSQNLTAQYGDVAVVAEMSSSELIKTTFYIRNSETPAKWVVIEGNTSEGESYQEIFQKKFKERQTIYNKIAQLRAQIPSGTDIELNIQIPFWYVAIARIHSILPIFEQEGSYYIDILEPLSYDKHMFGGGKNNIWPLSEITYQLGP